MEDLYSKQIPHDINAEQAVLGAMLRDNKFVKDITELLRADDFYSTTNKSIFESMYSLFSHGELIDNHTVSNQLQKEGYAAADIPEYLKQLYDQAILSSNAIAYAQIVKNKSILRRLAAAGEEIKNEAISGEGGADVILEAAEKKIYSLSTGSNRTELLDIKDIVPKVVSTIEELSKTKKAISGLETGFYDLDNMIMGLNRSDLILIASRPGMGKTAIALNIALHVAKTSDKKVAVFSLEMSSEQLAMRLLSSESKIDSKRLQTGQISSDADWLSLVSAAKEIGKAKLLINDDASLTVSEMNAHCRRVDNLGLVVIDYMQLMSSASKDKRYSGGNRVEVVTEISRTMKVMAKELDVPIICLSQLNRESEKSGDKRPMLSNLRESGSIEQDADVVIGLFRDDYYTKEESEFPNVAECIVLKNRRGATGTVKLMWNPVLTSFSSYSFKDDPDEPF